MATSRFLSRGLLLESMVLEVRMTVLECFESVEFLHGLKTEYRS